MITQLKESMIGAAPLNCPVMLPVVTFDAVVVDAALVTVVVAL